MSALASLGETMTALGWAYVIVFFRVGAAMAALPGFGERMIPVRIRLVLALAFTAVVAPAAPLVSGALSWTDAARFLLTESISGLLLGLVLRLFVIALQTAGAIAAQSTSLAQLLGGNAQEPLPAIGHILTISGLALFMIGGFHIRAVEYLVQSYHILPAGRFPNASDLALWGSRGVAKSFALAFQLAAPFVILSVLYNLAIGAINRAMPQLMVAFVGAPVITFGAIALVLTTAPALLATWALALHAFFDAPLGNP